MKKSLLALAVLGTLASAAQAQTNVTIGGFMAVQPRLYKIGSVNTAVRGAQTTTTEYRLDDDASSRIWFTGKEDLGGGSFARFYMESRFGGDNGSGSATFGLAAGDTFVGLGNNAWGTVDFGRISNSNYTKGILIELDRTGSANNFGTTTMLSDIGGFGVNKTRMNNTIRYTSPNFSGFTANVGVSKAPVTANEGVIGAAVNNNYNDGKAVELNLNYSNGPLYLNAAYFKVDQVGTNGATQATFATADNKSIRLSGSYTFPFGLKVGLAVDRSSVENVAAGAVMGNFLNTAFTAASGGGTVATAGQVQRTAWVLPITYTMGDHAFYAKYGQAGNLSNWTPATAGGGTGAKYYSLAWDYALSKRTAIGVSYTAIKNDTNGTYQPFAATGAVGHAGSSLFAGESVAVGSLNLKHSF